MTDYIDWKEITPRMKVVLVRVGTGAHWEAAGKTVLFGGRDEKAAQQWLNAREKRDRLGIRNNAITSDPSSVKWALRDAAIRCKGCINKKGCTHRGGLRIGTFCGYKQTRRP